MAASTQAFAPGPATRAFLHAANPFAPAPQTLLKALALLLAVPPTAATKTEEEDGTAEAASDFHAQLLGDIAAATEDFVYERLCSAVAPAAAAKGGDDGRAALEEVVQALARCDLLGHQEKTKASAASVTATTAEGQEAAVAPSTTSSTAAPVLPLSRRLLDATRGAWRRLSQPRALRFALLLARAADAALDPFAAPNDEMTAATSWRERVAAVGAVVGRFGCGRDVVRG